MLFSFVILLIYMQIGCYIYKTGPKILKISVNIQVVLLKKTYSAINLFLARFKIRVLPLNSNRTAVNENSDHHEMMFKLVGAVRHRTYYIFQPNSSNKFVHRH